MKMRFVIPLVMIATVLTGCGKTLVYRPMQGYDPGMPVAMAEARCQQGVSQQAQQAVNSARANAQSNASYTHSASCYGSGAYANCSGSSYRNDNSGFAAAGAALGAALSKNRRMKECMATYGFDSYEVD